MSRRPRPCHACGRIAPLYIANSAAYNGGHVRRLRRRIEYGRCVKCQIESAGKLDQKTAFEER